MRTTIDLPDPVFRKAKALAALRGSSLKDFVLQALEREIGPTGGKAPKRRSGKRAKFPLIPATGGKKVDLTGMDLDDLLA